QQRLQALVEVAGGELEAVVLRVAEHVERVGAGVADRAEQRGFRGEILVERVPYREGVGGREQRRYRVVAELLVDRRELVFAVEINRVVGRAVENALRHRRFVARGRVGAGVDVVDSGQRLERRDLLLPPVGEVALGVGNRLRIRGVAGLRLVLR